jgi:hypothetical protein
MPILEQGIPRITPTLQLLPRDATAASSTQNPTPRASSALPASNPSEQSHVPSSAAEYDDLNTEEIRIMVADYRGHDTRLAKSEPEGFADVAQALRVSNNASTETYSALLT